MKLSRPSPSGDRWPKDKHLDHLHVFAGGLVTEDVTTSRGPAQAAKLDVVACLDCREGWTDQLVFGKALVPRLTSDPDAEAVVGRLGQGLAKPGQSPPWVLDDPTDDDMTRADKFAGRFITELPSGDLVLDLKGLDTARDEPF
jgi:hypothetical protein